jgi:hypothetical protein
MSTTIDSLSIQIETSAGAATQNIDALAKSLSKLKDNASLTKVTNNLNKLATALNTLNGATGSLSGLTRLSTAMRGLASLPKLSGLNSALNTLKKLPDIVNRLGSTNLDLFTTQMRRLATALAPLAAQINSVAAGFASLPSSITRAISAINRMSSANGNLNNGLDTTNVNLAAKISNLGTLMSTLNKVIDVMAGFLAQAVEWDGIQFRFGRAFGEDAEEVYQYVLKINEALGINIQEFMQYSSLYGSLLSGFGMAQEKVTAISTGLTELSYDIWAAYNDRFKTLEQASEAVRSAITGEIEPIRNAGIALTEASLQEFIDSTHLAGVSIEKLTEAQKAEVRYAAMVNAAMSQGIVGTYAKEMDTAEGAVRSLSQSMKTLTQALGSLFIPMLQATVPYVTAFVEIITDAVFWIAELFGISMQKIDWSNTGKGVSSIANSAENVATGLGSAAKAAKKLKSYTLGFDELNVIDPNSGASGGAGGGVGDNGWGEGLDLKSLWDDSVFAEASKQVDEIKAKILGFMDEWKWAIVGVGVALGGLVVLKYWKTIVDWGTKIINIFNTVSSTIRAVWGAFKGSSAATSALSMISSTLSSIVGFLTSLTGPVILAIIAVIAAVASVVYFLYKNWDKVVSAVKTFFEQNIAPKIEKIKGHFDSLLEALGPVGDFFKNLDLEWVGTVFENIGGVIFYVVSSIMLTAFNALMGVLENVIQIFTGLVEIVSGVVSFIVALFKGDLQGAADAVLLMAEGIKNLFDGMVEFVVDLVVGLYESVVGWFKTLWDELVGHSIVPDTVNDIIDWFLKLPEKILGPIGDFVDDVLQTFKDLWEDTKSWWSNNVAPKFTKEYWKEKFDTIRAAIKDKLDEVKRVAKDKWEEVKSWFSNNIAPKLTKEYWLDKFKSLKEGFTQTIKNMLNAGIDLFNKFIGWINQKLNFTWEGLTIAGKEVYAGGSVQLFTIPTIPKFEKGGFIEDGLFTMNHGEIAGRFSNGRSVVANNEQIVAGIADGVYRAVVSAMSESQRGGEQNVNVYLDGKQVFASVKRTEAQRGANIMGNQLGYLY